jgi:hypothetical protein
VLWQILVVLAKIESEPGYLSVHQKHMSVCKKPGLLYSLPTAREVRQPFQSYVGVLVDESIQASHVCHCET